MAERAAKAVVFAVLAAVFYAVSSPVSKVLLEDVSPYLMAALLYLGAGIGMAVVRFLSPSKRAEERPLTKNDTPYIIGMIVLDIAAPILLMYGLLNSPASSVSLLNNFEIVATTLIALLVFGERVTPTTWAAIVPPANCPSPTAHSRSSWHASAGDWRTTAPADCPTPGL